MIYLNTNIISSKQKKAIDNLNSYQFQNLFNKLWKILIKDLLIDNDYDAAAKTDKLIKYLLENISNPESILMLDSFTMLNYTLNTALDINDNNKKYNEILRMMLYYIDAVNNILMLEMAAPYHNLIKANSKAKKKLDENLKVIYDINVNLDNPKLINIIDNEMDPEIKDEYYNAKDNYDKIINNKKYSKLVFNSVI